MTRGKFAPLGVACVGEHELPAVAFDGVDDRYVAAGEMPRQLVGEVVVAGRRVHRHLERFEQRTQTVIARGCPRSAVSPVAITKSGAGSSARMSSRMICRFTTGSTVSTAVEHLEDRLVTSIGRHMSIGDLHDAEDWTLPVSAIVRKCNRARRCGRSSELVRAQKSMRRRPERRPRTRRRPYEVPPPTRVDGITWCRWTRAGARFDGRVEVVEAHLGRRPNHRDPSTCADRTRWPGPLARTTRAAVTYRR